MIKSDDSYTEDEKKAIYEIREKSGVGIMHCAQAYFQCNGDIEKAIELALNLALGELRNYK